MRAGGISADRGEPILYIRAGAIGDLLLTIPLLRAAGIGPRRGRVEALLSDAAGRLAEALGLADRVASLGSSEWSDLFLPGGTPQPAVRRYLASFSKILCIIEDGDFVANLRNVHPEGVVCVDPSPAEEDRRHLAVQMLERLGRTEEGVVGSVLVERAACAPDRRTREMVIHPGSGSRKKCWPAGRFASVARKAAAEAGLEIVVVAGPADGAQMESFRKAAGGLRYREIRNPPFVELCGLLSRCRRFLGNDSGITHLASVLGAPTVAIYGPTDARVWGPLGPGACVIQGTCPRGARRQGRYRSQEHCETPECLAAVAEDSVLECVMKSLEREEF